ncbi:hypothetical protein CsatB_020503 [Cannabis sativa]
MSSSGRLTPRILNDDDDHHRAWYRPHNNSYDFSSKIMLTAIISLSIVVIFVLFLHLYARYVLRRQAQRRRQALHHLGLSMTEARSAAEPQQPKTGLEPSVIASLPVFTFNNGSEQERSSLSNNNECAVCLSNLEEGEMARLLPNCNHTFHAECIDKWLSSQSTCPICRTEAEPRPRPEPEPRESVAAPPTAPPLERLGSMSSCINVEGTTSESAKISNNGSSSRFSFRRMLSRERSSQRIQPNCVQEDHVIHHDDLERQ